MKQSKKQAGKNANRENTVQAKPVTNVPGEKPAVAIQDSYRLYNKTVFFVSLVAMLAIIWISGFGVGFHSDEMDMNNYCKTNIAYYASGGKDTSYLSNAAVASVATVRGIRRDTLLKYYGSSFDYLPVGFNKLTGIDKGRNEFNSRHIFTQFFAILSILFAGLIAWKIGGWRAAVFTQWLLFLTPTYFGHALMNTKDIPFATGYIASLYFIILFLEELPLPSWKTSLCLMLAFAFTTGMRIGGLMLIFYLLLFIAFYLAIKKVTKDELLGNARGIGLKIFVLLFGGLTLVVITWPYLLTNPLQHMAAAVNIINKFPVKITMPFEGNFITSLELPYYYLPKIMALTVPAFIIICFLASPFVLLRNKELNRRLILIVFFASIFPVVYAIFKHVSMYSTWRHFLFVYPGIIVVSGLALNEVMNWIKVPIFQKVFQVVCVLAMLHPIIWSIKNHPYEYIYYNEIEGGYKQAACNYEGDYWEISVKEGIDWLFKHAPIAQSKDTVYMISNASWFSDYYIKRNFPEAKVRIIDGGYKTRSFTGWSYGIFNSVVLPQNIMDFDFPAKNSIYTREVDNTPITTILKDSMRYDAYALFYLFKFDIRRADSFFNVYQQTTDKYNCGLYGYIGVVKAMKGDFAAALEDGKNGIEYDKYNFAGYLAIGLAKALNKQSQEALPFLAQAYSLALQRNAPVFGGMPQQFIADVLQQIDPSLMAKIEAELRAKQ